MTMSAGRAGRLVIVSGPSGVGKTTVMRRVFERSTVPLVASVSATTRPQRPGEVDGVDYHFLTKDEFEIHRKGGEFLECFEVFGRGDWYGTLRSEVTSGMAAGKWVVLRIDVQGALRVMQQQPDAVTIFIRPGSLEQLEARLRGRGTEPPEAVQRRLRQAERELGQAARYRYQVVNDDLDQAVEQICGILSQEWEGDQDAGGPSGRGNRP
jgi:guanylate kinase